MSKLKNNIFIISAIFSTIACILSIFTFIISRVNEDKLQKLIDKVGPVNIEISILSPKDGSEIVNYVAGISGKIIFKSLLDNNAKKDVILEFANKGIDIIPLVRPLSEANIWYAQTKPAITKEGDFHGSINIGDKEGRGIGINYQIIVIAVQKGTIKQGHTFRDLPAYLSAAGIITIKRIR